MISPLSLGMNALILCGVLGEISCGYKCAQYAMILLNKLDPAQAREVESRTAFHVYGFAWHWVNPLRSVIGPTLQAYEVGMQGGDTESAMFNISVSFFSSFICGTKLDIIEHDYRKFSPQMKKLKQGIMLIQCHITWQLILNLMGRSDFKTRLVGEALNEDDCRQEVQTNPVLVDSLDVHKMILCSFYGEYQCASDYAYKKGDSLHKTMPGLPTIPLYTFHRCLSLLAMARILQGRGSRKKGIKGHCGSKRRSDESKFVKSAKKALNKIRNWVEQGNPQSRHYQPLLEAELAAYQGQADIAVEKYETVIQNGTEWNQNFRIR